MTVSFYVEPAGEDKNQPTKSTIKFGNIDKVGYDQVEGLKLIRTASTKTWDIKTSMLKIGGEFLARTGFVRFEPQLPYLYLPAEHYKTFAGEVNKKFGKKACDID